MQSKELLKYAIEMFKQLSVPESPIFVQKYTVQALESIDPTGSCRKIPLSGGLGRLAEPVWN